MEEADHVRAARLRQAARAWLAKDKARREMVAKDTSPKGRAKARARIEFERNYQWVLAEMAETNEPIEMIVAQSGCANAWSVLTLSVRYSERLVLHEQLRRCSAREAAGLPLRFVALEAIERAMTRLLPLEVMPVLYRDTPRRPAHRLAMHPANWQEQMLANSDGLQHIALLIMMLCGARPGEIDRHIFYCIDSETMGCECLTLTFRGLKCTGVSGHHERRMVFKLSADNAIACALAASLGRYEGQQHGLFGQRAGLIRPKNTSTHVSRLAARLWPNHPGRPNAYSYRYAFRRALQQGGKSAEEIAEAMGHQSIRSQKTYGQAKPGQLAMPQPIACRGLVKSRTHELTMAELAVGTTLYGRVLQVARQVELVYPIADLKPEIEAGLRQDLSRADSMDSTFRRWVCGSEGSARRARTSSAFARCTRLLRPRPPTAAHRAWH